MTDFKTEVLKLTDFNDWDEKIKKTPQCSIFHSKIWAAILNEVFGLEHEIIAIMKNGNLISAFLIFYKIKYGIKVATKIPLTSYGGPLNFINTNSKEQKNDQYGIDALELMINTIKKEYKYFNITLHPSLLDVRPFLWNDWLITPRFTYIVDIRDEESIKEKFSSSLRRKITHAENSGLFFDEERSENELINLHNESYKRKGMKPILSSTLLLNFLYAVRKKEILKMYSVYDEKRKPYTSRAVLMWNGIIYDWIAGASGESGNATHYLVWRILQRYCKEGYNSFDFMGANTKKIIDFKRSFGGNIVPYYDIKYFSSFGMKMLFQLNDFLINLKR